MNLIANSNRTNQQTMTNAKLVWTVALFCAIMSSTLFSGELSAQQKPLRHFVPPNQKIKRIPARQPANKNNSNDFVKRNSLSPEHPEPIHTDRMVFKANHESNEVAAAPNRDSYTQRQTTQTDLPWSYHLKNLSYDEFQSKLAGIWGDRLMGSALDDDQRFIRIFFPESKTSPETSMKFDRVEGKLTYEGSPNRKAAWHRLMSVLDRRQSPNQKIAVEVLDIGNADQHLVQQVSAIFQDEDETDSIQVPDNLSAEELLKSENLPKLEGQIQISVSQETGVVILTGPPEDIAKLRKFINEVLSDSGIIGARGAKRIQLLNSEPDELQEKIQGIYDEQFAEIHGPARIESVPSLKSLVAVGSNSAILAIENVVKELDGTKIVEQPEPGDLTELEKAFRVFRVQHISATEAEAAVLNYFGAATNTNNNSTRQALPVSTHVDQRSNSLTVFASPPLLVRAAALLNELDIAPQEGGKNKRVLKVFTIRNHRAGDFAVILQDALNGGFQQNTGLTESTIQNANNNNTNQFQNNQQNTGQAISSIPQIRIEVDGQLSQPANFFDVRITADNASNRIAVVAPEESMPLIAEIISQLDQLPDIESAVKTFPIINGDAQEVLATLEALFTGGQQAGGNQTAASLSDLPLQSPSSDGASLINVRFAVSERTNTIIASGAISDLEFVGNLIYRLDEKDVRDRHTMVYRLSNANVADVNAAINTFLDSRQAIYDANPLSGGGPNNTGIITARRSVIVVEEATSNSLLVNARPEMLREIDMIIQRLDRRPPMVKVKAMIVQVNLNQLENFGVEFGLQDSSIFDAGLNDTIGTGFVGLDNPAGQLITDLGVGRGAGLGGLVLSAGDESLNFVLRFLKQKGCAEILFAPQVMTMENLEGRFNQGASIQRATGFNQGVGGILTQNFTEVQTGITLAITPRVSPDGMIVMFVDVTNSSLGAEADGTVIGTDQFGNAIRSQPINQTVAQTTIMSRSGQTVAISGLMQEQKSQSISSVPFLGDLPVVGPLFQSVENMANRSELLIILTPYIVDGPDDISAMNEDDFNRMHWCKCDIAELYGDTSYTGSPYREQSPVVIYPDADPHGNHPDLETGNGFETPANGNNPLNLQDGNEQVFPEENSWRGRDQGSNSRNRTGGFNGNSEQYETLPPSSRYQTPMGQPIRSAREYNEISNQRYGNRPIGHYQQNDNRPQQYRNSGLHQGFHDRQTSSPIERQSHGQQLPKNRSLPQQNSRLRNDQYVNHTFSGQHPPANNVKQNNYSSQSNPPLELQSRSSGARFRLH